MADPQHVAGFATDDDPLAVAKGLIQSGRSPKARVGRRSLSVVALRRVATTAEEASNTQREAAYAALRVALESGDAQKIHVRLAELRELQSAEAAAWERRVRRVERYDAQEGAAARARAKALLEAD